MVSRISAKLFAVVLLTILILAALLAVGITISSRESYRAEAVQSISESYAGAQTVVGPVLAEHSTEDVTTVNIDAKGLPTTQHGTRPVDDFILPKMLTFTGTVVPSERHHGLYGVTVYELHARIEEDFDVPQVHKDKPVETTVRLAISDVRGLLGLPSVEVNGNQLSFRKGTSSDTGGGEQRNVLIAPITAVGKSVHIRMDLNLGGTQQLRIAPIADVTQVKLDSTWPSPLFGGKFLPRSRSVDKSGFKAEWGIPGLATSAPQAISASLTVPVETLDVSLIQPSDPYKLSDRATKYGVLFVVLTFGGFFVFEVMKQLPIHPVQYLLVGFALALFFLLLISLSEHMPFGEAYLIGSIASIGLLGFYLTHVLHSLRRGAIFSAMISVLFAVIYGLLQSEDNALLLGTLMLFTVLALVMIVTRRVDWYSLSNAPTFDQLSTKQVGKTSLPAQN